MTLAAELHFRPDTLEDLRAGFDADGMLERNLAELWEIIADEVPNEVRRFWMSFAGNPVYGLDPAKIEQLIARDIDYTARKYRGPLDQELIDRMTRRGRRACRDRGTEVGFAGALLRNVQQRHARLRAALANDPDRLARLTDALYALYAIENGVLFNGGALARADHEMAAAVEQRGKLRAIDESQCWLEMTMDGRILTANRNFLTSMDYTEQEVVGRHHAIFCSPAQTETACYASFWDKLRAGEFVQGEFERVSRSGAPVYLQATYSPVFGVDGQPVKIVKCATDVTAMRLSERSEAMKAERFRDESDQRRLRHEETLAELSRIVDDISTVTRQTGMLALNASIEAVRAGEAGKSFAVVAGEVKTMSGRIRQATSRATSLLSAGLRSVAA
jgi:PAS domain S-box-containing protein